MMRWLRPRAALFRLTARWPALQQPATPWLRAQWQALGRRVPRPVAAFWIGLRREVPRALSSSWGALRRAVPPWLASWWAGIPWPEFRSVVAVCIAFISILGAYVAWRAALASTEASDLDQRYLQELVQRETRLVELHSRVIQDFRVLARYQEHIRLWRLFQLEAQRADSTDRRLAAALRARAHVELALARSLRPFFRVQDPDWGTQVGDVAYSISSAVRWVIDEDRTLENLRTRETGELASLAHLKAWRLTGVVALFVASLLFLTLAEFTRPRIRRVFAAVGALVVALGFLAWLMVEPF